jgi:hypothetical protein
VEAVNCFVLLLTYLKVARSNEDSGCKTLSSNFVR